MWLLITNRNNPAYKMVATIIINWLKKMHCMFNAAITGGSREIHKSGEINKKSLYITMKAKVNNPSRPWCFG